MLLYCATDVQSILADCTRSVACVPSQYGLEPVCLHPHKYTSQVSSTVNRTGFIDVPDL